MNKREIQLPDDGSLECWGQVSPVGEFEAEQDGQPIVQLCDMEAFRRLVAAFNPAKPVLVDFEHRSETGDDTLAAGWVHELRCSEEDGLEARVVWTDLGAGDLRNKRRARLHKQRRESVVGASGWKISPCNPERTRGYDKTLAEEQAAFLYEAYGRADDSISEAAEHLERGFFRGFAHARPIYGRESLEGFELLDQWNFAYDKLGGAWWWNPDATSLYNDSMTPIPHGELVSVVRQRHIDYPALAEADVHHA